MLRAVPVGTWSDPQAAGWQRVKDNARREVWRAVICGVPYYLKYYFRDRWWRRLGQLFRPPACRAEWEGGLFTARAGIAAPQPVAFTRDLRRGRRRCDLLVTEAIEPAQPLNDFWLQLGADADIAQRRRQQSQLTELLAELIARAHQAGFEHLDMHAANILVQPLAPQRYRVLFIDLQSARRGVPLSDQAVVRNLAQLNQWFRRHSSVADRLRFLRAYLRWRCEFEPQFAHARALDVSCRELVAKLQTAAHRHAERLWAQRDRRAARNGRYFLRLKLPGGWRGMAVATCKHATDESRASQMDFTRQWWRQQFTPPLRGLAGDGATACKNSHSAAVCRATLEHDDGQLPVIVKRPLARNWHRRLALLLRPSRSLRGWRMGHALLHRDLPTARPLAVLERRWGPLVLDSLLVTEALPEAVDLETFLKRAAGQHSPADWYRLKRELCRCLARNLRRLEERGFEHRDCKASNVLVVPRPQLALLWIDMDGLRHKPIRRAAPLRALVRLHVSLLNSPGLTRTDRVRFLKLYFARYGQPADGWRALWPALVQAGAEKISAQEARRRWKLEHYGRE
jgi:hypothetical protein